MTTPRHPLLTYLMQRAADRSPLLIVAHDHPDPDAIASAWALAFLAERLRGVRAKIVYGGIIGRMENQLMVRLLRIPLHPVRSSDFERFPHVALVDSQPPFQNNCCPSNRRATIVVDHHPRHPRTDAELLLIDETAGATSTLLSEAVLASNVEAPTRLATALVYGIGSETQNLVREAGPRDIAAYRALFAKASVRSLSKIQNPPRPESFFRVLARAIRQAFVVERIVGVHLGPVPSQDIVSHMADFLLTHEWMRWAIVTGRYDGWLYVSLRTHHTRANAGRLLWRLLGSGTTAGGHQMIAGGAIRVGRDATDSAWRATETRLVAAFLASQGYQEPFEFRHPFLLEDEAR